MAKKRLNREDLLKYFNTLGWKQKNMDILATTVFDFLLEASESTLKSHIVIDAGAGEQRYKPFFQHAKYIAIDFTKGNSSWDYNKLDINADIANLPIKSESVDIIINTSTLEHTREPSQVICEFYRVIKKNGMVFLYAPHTVPEHQQPFDYYRYTQYGLKYLFEKACFELNYVKPSNGIFYSSYIYLQHASGHIPIKYVRGFFQRIFIPFLKSLFCLLDRFDNKKNFPILYLCKATKT